MQTSLNYEDSTPVCETGRRLEVCFSHCLMLNWNSVNKLRLWLTLRQSWHVRLILVYEADVSP